jgi:tRNA(fMet)-specific endonuclease VapC
LADADLQIAATALIHDLELVTGNVKHFKRVPGLRLSPVLAEARTRS